MMEFYEKLQILRKQKGLTQEELAQRLYVSRAAVSKWESGRGYPNIESLKAIAQLFSVSIDELLSGDELLTIAEEDNQKKEAQARDLAFGILDASVMLFSVLPLFAQKTDTVIQAVSLFALTTAAPYMRIIYISLVVGMTALGAVTLALQSCQQQFRITYTLSLLLNVVGVLLFIIGLQPYAASELLLFLVIKGLLLLKRV